MADDVDIANEYCDHQIQALLARRTVYMGESARYCEACGDPIPKARRIALPGVSHCVYCAEERERAVV